MHLKVWTGGSTIRQFRLFAFQMSILPSGSVNPVSGYSSVMASDATPRSPLVAFPTLVLA